MKSSKILILVSLVMVGVFQIGETQSDQNKFGLGSGKYTVTELGGLNSYGVDVVTDVYGINNINMFISSLAPGKRKWTTLKVSATSHNDNGRRQRLKFFVEKNANQFHHKHSQWTGPGLDAVTTRLVVRQKKRVSRKDTTWASFVHGQICIAAKEPSGELKKVVPLGTIWNDTANSFHPAFFLNSNTIVFASTELEGFGGSDLYFSTMERDGWSDPVNLGPKINSSYDEAFPTFNDNGDLFFSTNDPIRTLYEGGDFDILMAKWLEVTRWDSAVTLDPPLNSHCNDYGLVWKDRANWGFFTSDRINNDHDIFKFEYVPMVQIAIVDSQTQEVVFDAAFKAGVKMKTFESFEHNRAGNLRIPAKPPQLRCYEWYQVKADGYRPFSHTPVRWKSLQGVDYYDTLRIAPINLYSKSGILVNADDGTPIDSATVTIYNQDLELTDSIVVKENGKYHLSLNPGNEYFIRYEAPGYYPQIDYKDLAKEKGFSWEIDTVVRLKRGGYWLLEGDVFDSLGGPLAGTNIRLYDNKVQDSIGSWVSGKKGKFWIPVPVSKSIDYSLIFSKTGYMGHAIDYVGEISGFQNAIVQLDAIQYDSIALTFFHDYNKSEVNLDNMRKTGILRYTLIDNPQMGLRVYSHTDPIGGAEYNRVLSCRRAEKTKAAIAKGKQKLGSRILCVGYGEQYTLSKCGELCTKNQVWMDRRSECIPYMIKTGSINLISTILH